MITQLKTEKLLDRAILKLSGENPLAFLHNILTCDLINLPAGQWRYGALLSPQGKIQHDVFVAHCDDTVFIDCATPHVQSLLQKLMLYRLRSKIEIVPDPSLSIVVSDHHQSGIISAIDPRVMDMGYRNLVANAAPTEHLDYHKHRITFGLPDSVMDIGTNQLFPHEANLDVLAGVSFTKGCYVGQEVVSRMQHRGTARSRILAIASDGAMPINGTAITAGESAVGTILSSLENIGLALIRIDRWKDATTPVTAAGIAIHLSPLAWLPPAILEHTP